MITLLLGAVAFVGLLYGLNRLFWPERLDDPYECGFFPLEPTRLRAADAVVGTIRLFVIFELELIVLLLAALQGSSVWVLFFLALLIWL